MDIDVKSYVESHIPALIKAGRRAYNSLGRGALICFPQRDQGNGNAAVKFLTEQMLVEDDDPALQIVQQYDPNNEVVFIVALDAPRDIITYLIGDFGVRKISCHFCNAEPIGNTTPPLCPKHLDIVILVSHLQRNDLDVSLDNALTLLNGCQADGGWTITKAELEIMFPEFLEQTTPQNGDGIETE